MLMLPNKTTKKIISIALGLSILSMQPIRGNINIYDYVEKPKKTEFKNVIIFGDSLSDANYQDKSRYVAGGPNYPGYFDVLSQYFSSKPSQFITYGGTNYAVSASPSHTVYEQVRHYLAENNNHASKNDLHVLWAGGTDVNTTIIFNLPKLPFYDFSQPDYTIYNHNKPNPTEMIKESAELLLDRGAPYVIVPNIPNSGYAPITSLFHVDVTVTVLSIFLPSPLDKQVGLKIRKAYGKYLDAKLRGLPQGQGHDFLINRGIDSLQLQFPFIPRFVLKTVFNTIVNIGTDITRQFNHSTLKALMPLNGKIAYIDVATLFNEIIDNAIDWHVGSVNLTSCSLSYRSADCFEDNGTFYTDRHYLFGDWFHPSWESHVGIAQYIISVLSAPDQISSIIKQLNNLNDSNQASLQSYLIDLRSNLTQSETGWSIFGGYSGLYDIPKSYIGGAKNTYTNILSIGLNYQYSPHLTIGTLLSFSYGKHKPYENFTYRQNSQDITLYTQWINPSEKYWFNASINYGRLNAKNIQRSIKLGEIYRIEPANTSTNSQMYGLNIRGGWNIWSTNEDNLLRMGPLLGLGYNHYQLKGFQEKYNHATSMYFGDAKHHQTHATLGWYVHAPQFAIKNKPANISAEITYNQNLKDEDLEITSHVKTSPLYLKKKVELTNNNKWVDMNSNLSIQLNKATTLNTGLGFKVNNKKNKNIQFSVSIQQRL